MQIDQYIVSDCCGALVISIGGLIISYVCKECGKPTKLIDEKIYFRGCSNRNIIGTEVIKI